MYLVKAVTHTGDVLYKIGVTKRPIKFRLKELQTANPAELTLESFIETEYAYRIESILHRRFRSSGIAGEWFTGDIDPADFLLTANTIHASISAYYNAKNDM